MAGEHDDRCRCGRCIVEALSEEPPSEATEATLERMYARLEADHNLHEANPDLYDALSPLDQVLSERALAEHAKVTRKTIRRWLADPGEHPYEPASQLA